MSQAVDLAEASITADQQVLRSGFVQPLGGRLAGSPQYVWSDLADSGLTTYTSAAGLVGSVAN